MKHKKLFVLILVCVIVFIGSSVAGVITAARVGGWQSIDDDFIFDGNIARLLPSFNIFGIFNGTRVSKSIDKSLSIDLDGIDTIKIVDVSEELTIGATDGKTVDCSLKGSYFTFGDELTYQYKINGGLLTIYPDYPKMGLQMANIAQKVLIPADFTGNVIVGVVSGGCTISGENRLSWSSLSFNGVSGSLNLSGVNVPDVDFESISGSVNLERCTGAVSGNTVSGSIKISWDEFAGGSLNSISGSVDLRIPLAASCVLNFKTVSGSLNNQGLDLEMTQSGSGRSSYTMNGGRYELSVETVSGSLQVSP